ncbi:MAG: D-glycero-beta-D-manno-heptose 1-phosphate adenylyltransferase [Phycisphaerae bacterium]|jgi:D-beta-D-heptose 7-phosphate kinase/D-beta-D-heptose 1-phosphate adenosyltransferase
MYEQLLKTITNLGSPRVLLVGDFMLDVYIYGDALRISPEAPVLVLKVQNSKYACGGAGSVANDLLALGAKVSCIGITGDDDNGGMLRKMLNEAGADTTGLLAIPQRPTTTKQRLIGLAQHRHPQQLIRIDDECCDALPQDAADQIEKLFNKELDQADIICLQDYNKALLTDSVCRFVIQQASKAGKKVLVDPAYITNYSKYVGATLITPNRKEASTAAGFEIKNPNDVTTAAKQLCETLKLDAVVITLDKEGAYLQTDKISKLISTIPRNVYDVTGAGDMVLAALTVTLAADCDYETAVRLANIAGGIEVEKFGAATVTIDEIVNEIISVHRGKSGKIRSVNSILTELDWHRKLNEKIVFTNGCFDVLHRGHIEFLKFCKAQGDIVVLGLNSDSSVKQIKGPQRPINNQHDRAAVLAALETVNYIIIFDQPDPMNLISQVKPDVLVKGQDWQDKGVIGREFVESYGGKVVLAPLVQGKSSTATIEKMNSLNKE